MSLCYNAVDRHVDEGKGNTNAIIWDSPITGQKSTLTYKQLRDNVSIFLACKGHSDIIRSMIYRKHPTIVEFLIKKKITGKSLSKKFKKHQTGTICIRLIYISIVGNKRF